MIPAVHKRGTRVGGLLRYLYGPGRREEHTDPHLVAAWDGAGNLADLEPVLSAAGRRDFRHLVDLLEIPVRAGRNPPRLPVWHASVRAHATDQHLTDAQWADIAAEVIARTGIAAHGDTRAARWIAVRHADDHIHIVATLVRQDRRAVWLRHDYARSQAACREVEQSYNLYRVGAPSQGSRSWPSAAETNKAHRRGRTMPPREELRRRVREAATVAVGEDDFFTRLARAGVQVRLRHSDRDPSQITGYSVALPGDSTAANEQIFYGGGKLATDLSLPRLRQRWSGDTTLAGTDRRAHQLRPAPAEVYERAAQLITDAAGHINVHADNPRVVAVTAAAAADLLTAAATTWEGTAGGPLTRAAELFDRAAHEHARLPPAATGTRAFPLRAIARLVHATGNAGRRRDQRELQAMLQLIRAMAGLADALASLRAAHERLHQADAARAAADLLHGYRPPPATTLAAPTRPTTPQPATPTTLGPSISRGHR